MSLGILNKTQFSYKSLGSINSTNSLPVSVRLNAYIFGTYLNVTLNQVQGNPSLNSQVFLKQSFDTPVNKLNLTKLVSLSFYKKNLLL